MPKLCFLIFLLISSNCLGQIDTLRNQYLRIQPSQVLFRELVLEYEHPVTERLTLSIGAGYLFPKGGEPSELGRLITYMTTDYRLKNMVNPHYHGIKISITPRYYLNPRKTFFISAELFARYWWFDKVPFHRKSTGIFSEVKSEQMEVFGGKLLVGYNAALFSLTNGHNLYFTPFGGIGLRSKDYLYRTWYNDPAKYERESGKFVVPSIHMGVSIAYAIKN